MAPLSGRNNQLPVLRYALVESKDGVLHLTCTDLEVGAHVIVGGRLEQEGGCAVSARQLFEYVQQLPASNPIVIKKEKKGLVVETKNFNAVFPVVKTDDFPLLPTPTDENSVVVDGRVFCAALNQTLFSAAKEDTRPEIHSVYVSGEGSDIKVAATDSFRLAERVITNEKEVDFGFLLPVNAANEVVRFFNGVDQLSVVNQENFVAFSGEGKYMSTRLIDGSYPNYHQIIPKKHRTRGLVKKEDFLRALKTLSVFLTKDTKRVLVAVKPSKGTMDLNVEGGGSGQGMVKIRFEGDGDEIESLFNAQYLMDGVARIIGDDCDIGLGDKGEPLVIRPKSKNIRYLYIVMPIQA